MASSQSFIASDLEELGLDTLGKSCTYCTHAGGSCDEVSCKKQLLDKLCCLTIEDLKCTNDRHIEHYVSPKLNGGYVPNDEPLPETEEKPIEYKNGDIRKAFVAAKHDATLTVDCGLLNEMCTSGTHSNLHNMNIIELQKDEADCLVQKKADLPACSPSNSVPSAAKLVSAMKGGREQHGIVQITRPRVSWAADVMDPPVTSVSHTVRSGYHRPKPKKDKKHKHSKGKSNHGSSNGRKQHLKRSNASDNHLHSRLNAPVPLPVDTGIVDNLGDSVPLPVDTAIVDKLVDSVPLSVDTAIVDKLGDSVSTIDYVTVVSAGHFLELTMAGHDKCGSSFLRRALGKMHLPYAETI